MTTTMHAASSQWATRPADQRFWTLAEMTAACANVRRNSKVCTVPFADLKAHAYNGQVMLRGPAGNPAKFSHYAFSQFASSVGAPAGYLRDLPADLAAQNLNAGIARAKDRSDRNLLFCKGDGALSLRASLSESYERIWDEEVCQYLKRLTDAGWRAPAGLVSPAAMEDVRVRPATADDLLEGQINIQVGDLIGPAGLYASDHDMFAFLVAPDRVIDDGTGKPLMRGCMIRNSEVGDSSLYFTFFLCQAICGNHIIWSPKGVHEVRVRHAGRIPFVRALRKFDVELRRYHDAAPEEERIIASARKLVLGDSKDDVLDALLKYARSNSLPISLELLKTSYDVAVKHESWYGDPNTLWAQVSGLTHASQETGFADTRAVIDRAAAKFLSMAH